VERPILRQRGTQFDPDAVDAFLAATGMLSTTALEAYL
jgi:response regulator RpfG family c-di-GMP phosphodiesterase